MKKLIALFLASLISTQSFAASSALNFSSLGVRSSGMIGTDLIAYTPVITGMGSTSSVEFFYRRVGDSLFIQGKFISGVGTATEARFSLPTGLTIDSIKVPSKIGAGIMHQNSTASRAWDILITGGLSYVTVGRWDGGNSPLNNALGDNVDGGGGSTLYFNATMPITGWTSGGDGGSTVSYIGGAEWLQTTNCIWGAAASNQSWQNFTADTDCPNPTVNESVSAPGTKIPAVTFTAVAGAVYQFTFSGQLLDDSGAGTGINMRISNGTDFSKGSLCRSDDGCVSSIVETVQNTLSGSQTFQIQCTGQNGSEGCLIANELITRKLRIDVTRIK